MSKADEKSNQYRDFREQCGIKDPVMLNEIEEACYEGYHQAEKDLELGWEQIYSILYFEREVLREFGNEEHSNEEVCKEVLKRFKDFKERKDGGKG